MLRNNMMMLVNLLIAVSISATLPGSAAAEGVYTVKAGDSLYRISRAFHVSVEQVKEANGLSSNMLHPGDSLRIPGGGGETAAPSASPKPPGPAVQPARPRCRGEVVTHTIRQGDTLERIARKYRVPVGDLLELNGIGRRTILRIGRELVVSSDGPRVHTVERGESLASIAGDHSVGMADLLRLNGLSDDRLKPGQELLLEACVAADRQGAAPANPIILAASTWDFGPAAEFSLDGPEPLPSAASASVTDRLIAWAKNLLNIPYRFGGSSLRGIDCSAYVQKVFSFLDVPLPRTAREQFKQGLNVSKAELAIGDLVFFRTYARYASHVGIYLGDNLFIHASSKDRKVAIDRLDDSYYTKRYMGAKRVLVDEGPAEAQETAAVTIAR